jgi:excinuclease ABC subunit C
MQETLTRRFRNSWKKPDLILIDGGLPQVNAARDIVHRQLKLHIPVIGIAKGPDRDRDDLVFHEKDPDVIRLYKQYLPLLARVRDEAHRFAITFHRKTRTRNMIRGE